MEFMDFAVSLLRWFHIAAGLFFIGLNWWFNFVFTPYNMVAATETRKNVLLELIPRALYWFRWAALYTAILGIGLLVTVFYSGGLTIESQQPWSMWSYVMVVLAILLYKVYDLLAKSPIGKDIRIFGVVGLLVVAAYVYAMQQFGQFSYRGYVIHVGVLFGVIMIGNVWEKIWPAQKKVLNAVKAGTPPDPAQFALVTQRGRHNTYLSIPLLWTMIEAHTAVPAANSWLYLIVVIVIGWGAVALAFTASEKTKGW